MFSEKMKFYAVLMLTAVWSLSVQNATMVPSETIDLDGVQRIDSVRKAADYLMSQWHSGDWNSLSPRVVVALAFTERAGVIPGHWLSLLKKEVNIHVRANIVKWKGRPSLCDLAHSINALYATCQDPRHFHGIDLVGLLRTEADAAGNKLDAPFVLLTLCLARQIDHWDLSKLMEMNFRVRDATLGSKAVIAMAMECISRVRGRHPTVQKELADFARNTDQILRSLDIYTKILHVQALNALNYKPDVDLSAGQLQNGSFGDVLATYYAIPALLDASLLDLGCKTSKFAVSLPPTAEPSDRSVLYSLWIERGAYLNAHSMSVPLTGNQTFYDLMRTAEAENPLFSFLWERSGEGRRVYSLAGIPNDAEREKAWNLYRGRGDRVVLDSTKSLAKQAYGVDRIFPTAGDHFVFWYERS